MQNYVMSLSFIIQWRWRSSHLFLTWYYIVMYISEQCYNILQDWVNYFNTIFGTAGVDSDFTSDTTVIVETPD